MEFTLEQLRELEKIYTDRMDVNLEESLFEYGIIRNPKNGYTVFVRIENDSILFDFLFIELDEVKEILSEIENDFFSFIGSNREKEIEEIDNSHLSSLIHSINMYQSYFDVNYREISIEELYNKIKEK